MNAKQKIEANKFTDLLKVMEDHKKAIEALTILLEANRSLTYTLYGLVHAMSDREEFLKTGRYQVTKRPELKVTHSKLSGQLQTT